MDPAPTLSASLFASDRHAPRRRRPSHAFQLVRGALAFAVAITYRLLGRYLPPVLGFFSLRSLKRESYL